jgi:hypothetical protein
MIGVDTALMFYCQPMEIVMISFRIDIARKNDERLVYDKIDNLFLFTHPPIQQRTEEVQGDGLRLIMSSSSADDVNNKGSNLVQLTLSQSMELEGIVIRYDISKMHRLILVGLNHKYANKTIVSNLYSDWVKTTDTLLCALPMFLSLGNR